MSKSPRSERSRLYFSKIHYGHQVAYVLYDAQVMGYEEVGETVFFLQILKKVYYLRLDGHIKR